MATQIERFTAIIGALKDGTPDQGLMLRVADAFVSAYYRQGDGDPAPEDLTNAQKAAIFNKATRAYVKEVVVGTEAKAAASAAREAAIANPPDLGEDSA